MAYKTKPDTAGLAQLKKDLAQGKPGRLYVFHGEETYLRDHYLGKLREVLLSGGMGEFNLHRLRPADVNPRALEEAVDCLPMMAERTLVEVTDFDLFKAGEKDREGYIRILSNLPDYCCLIFVYDVLEYKPDARTKLAQAVKAGREHRSLYVAGSLYLVGEIRKLLPACGQLRRCADGADSQCYLLGN